MPELLDELEPGDPRASRSRRDLRRVHRAMGSASIMKRAISDLRLAARPRRVLELGAGDGSLMLRVAQAARPPWRDVSLTLLDRHDLVSTEIRDAYEVLGWRVTVLQKDVLEWSAGQTQEHFDLCVCSLFLHHFANDTLPVLMSAIAARADALVACEPRRNLFARLGSELIFLLGTNRVTQEDAVKSVAAGFSGRELTSVWPALNGTWDLEEYAAPPFTHCFCAVRRCVRHG